MQLQRWSRCVLVALVASAVGVVGLARPAAVVADPPPPPVNILGDEAGGFEQPPLPWIGQTAHLEIASEVAHSGLTSLRAQVQPLIDGQPDAAVHLDRGIAIEVEEDEPISASAWIRGQDGGPAASVVVAFFGVGGSFVDMGAGTPITPPDDAFGQAVVEDVETPPMATHAIVGVVLAAPEEGDLVWLDDVQMWRSTTVGSIGAGELSGPVRAMSAPEGGWTGQHVSIRPGWIGGGYDSAGAARLEVLTEGVEPNVPAVSTGIATVVEDETYTMRVQVADPDGAEVEVLPLLVWMDGETVVDLTGGTPAVTAPGAWVALEATGVVPAGATSLQMVVAIGAGPGTVLALDGALLWPGGDPDPGSGANLLSDETSELEVAPAGWAGWNAVSDVTSTAARSGYTSLRLQSEGPQAAALTSLGVGAIEVTAGSSYELRAWVATVGEPGTATAAIQWFGSSGPLNISTGPSVAELDSEWTELDITGIAPPGATHAALTVRAATPGAETAAHFLDDIGFYELPLPDCDPGTEESLLMEEEAGLLEIEGYDSAGGEPGPPEDTGDGDSLGEQVGDPEGGDPDPDPEVEEEPGFEGLEDNDVGEQMIVLLDEDEPSMDDVWVEAEIPPMDESVFDGGGGMSLLVDDDAARAGERLSDGRVATAGIVGSLGGTLQTRGYTSGLAADSGWGTSGIAPFPEGSKWNGVVATAADGEDMVIVASDADDADLNRLAVARVNGDGSADTSFSTDGLRVHPFDTIAADLAVVGTAAAVGEDHEIWAGALFDDDLNGPSEVGVAVYRFDSGGSLMASFGSSGMVNLRDLLPTLLDSEAIVRAVHPVADGAIVEVWAGEDVDDLGTVLVRLDDDGDLVTGYGYGGVVVIEHRVGGTVLTPTGGILAVSQHIAAETYADFVRSFRSDSFDDDGAFLARRSFGLSWSVLPVMSNVALDPGKGLLARFDRGALRIGFDGRLDRSFGAWGGVQAFPEESWEMADLAPADDEGVTLIGNGSEVAVKVLRADGDPHDPPEEEQQGEVPGAPEGGDPVELSTGNYTTTAKDLDAPTHVWGADIDRYYNSQGREGVFGPGWSSLLDIEATEGGDGSVTVVDATGRHHVFPPATGGGWDSPPSMDRAALALESGELVLRFDHGEWWRFGADGLLEAKGFNGQTVTIARSVDDITVTSSTGWGWTATLADHSVASIEATDDRVVTYEGVPGGFMVHVPDGGSFVYVHGPSRQLGWEIRPDGTWTQTTYGSDGKVELQQLSTGHIDRFCYDAPGLEARVIDVTSGTELTYSYDADQHLDGIEDPLGGEMSYAHDAAGRLTDIEDRLGAEETRDFDGDGRLVSIVDEKGTTTFTWDGQDRMATRTVPGEGTTTYTYTGTDRIATTVEDEQGAVTTNVVDDGLILSTTDGDGVTTTNEFDPVTRRLVATEDELGNRTEHQLAAGPEPGWTVETTVHPLGGRDVVVRDGSGRERSSAAGVPPLADPDDHATVTTYDSAGRVTRVDEPGGGFTETTYDAVGQVATETTPAGTTTYFRNEHGQIVAIANPDGTQMTQAWGTLGRLLSRTDETGRTTRFEYDANGNRTKVIDPAGEETVTTYDAAGRVTKVTDPEGRETLTTYDAHGRTLSTTDAAGALTQYIYDELGQVIKVIDGREGQRATEFTPGRRTELTVTPADVGITSTYDAAGRLLYDDGPDGRLTYGYDDDGHRTSVTHSNGQVTTYEYDWAGRETAVVDPAGVRTETTYDAAGRIATRTGPNGTVTNTWDDDGNLIAVEDGNGNVTEATYDWRGNRLTVTDALDNVTRWTYDRAGRPTSVTDPLGRTTRYGYDRAGHQTTVTDPADGITTDTVDATGQILTRQMPDATTMAFTYDPVGRLETATDPSGTLLQTWSDSGDLLSRTTPAGETTTFTYDAAGRRTRAVLPSGVGYDYSYHPYTGRVEAITADRLLVEDFDAELRASQWELPGAGAAVAGGALDLSAEDGADARLDARIPPLTEVDLSGSVSPPSGGTAWIAVASSTEGEYRVVIDATGVLSLERHGAGGPATVEDTAASATATGASADVRVQVEGSTVRARAWDPLDPEPTGWDVSYTDPGPLASGGAAFGATAPSVGAVDVSWEDVVVDDPSGDARRLAYTWTDFGTPATETTATGGRAWGYTDGRLTSFDSIIDGATTTTSVTYEADGQVATLTDPGGTSTFGYDAAGQLTSVAAPGGTRTITYSDLGQRTTDTLTGTYAYDDAGQLETRTLPAAAGVVTYTYDALGRRVEADGPDGTTTYAYASNGRLGSVDGPASDPVARTWNPDGTLASVDGTEVVWDGGLALLAVGGPDDPVDTISLLGGVQWSAGATSLAVDLHGTPGVGADSLFPTVTSTPPFGEGAAPGGTAVGFLGLLTAPDGLVHMRAREYDPTTGQFLTPDALGGIFGTPVVAHRYHYADNDPVGRSDGMGLVTEDCDLTVTLCVSPDQVERLADKTMVEFAGTRITAREYATAMEAYRQGGSIDDLFINLYCFSTGGSSGAAYIQACWNVLHFIEDVLTSPVGGIFETLAIVGQMQKFHWDENWPWVLAQLAVTTICLAAEQYSACLYASLILYMLKEGYTLYQWGMGNISGTELAQNVAWDSLWLLLALGTGGSVSALDKQLVLMGAEVTAGATFAISLSMEAFTWAMILCNTSFASPGFTKDYRCWFD